MALNQKNFTFREFFIVLQPTLCFLRNGNGFMVTLSFVSLCSSFSELQEAMWLYKTHNNTQCVQSFSPVRL